MNVIKAARCVQTNEDFVELALREALSNAVIHGNRLEASKLVHVHCCCDCTRVFVIVSDQGQGFDPSHLPDPLAVENLSADHGRGIHLMKLAAIKAYREGKLPFPDGTIIAALHFSHTSSEENNKVFGRAQSFVAGPPTNTQLMVKDSTKYATTSGWGFGCHNQIPCQLLYFQKTD